MTSSKATLSFVALTAVLLAVLGMVWACGGDNKTAVDGDDDTIDDDDDDQDTTPPDPPELDPLTSPTPLTIQTITGTAEPDCTITVLGGAQQAATASDPISGSWCVTVSLNNNTSNDLEITATDAALNVSEPARAAIVQDPGSGPQERNLGEGAIAYASSISTSDCPECTPDKAIDNNAATWWHNSTNTLTNPEEAARYPQWLAIKRLERFTAQRAVIVWQSVMFATDYVIYYSDLASPPDPHEPDALHEPYWYAAHVQQMGTGGTEYIEFEQEFTAQWVAVVLFLGNDINELTGKPRYAIAEFELWGVPVDEQPTDPGCDK